jgi:hypothetical protein
MSHFAFRSFKQRQRPRIVISRLDGWPAGFPCQRFASHLAMRVRMTRGQGDSPFLPRIGLAPTTTCQFVLAHLNTLFARLATIKRRTCRIARGAMRIMHQSPGHEGAAQPRRTSWPGANAKNATAEEFVAHIMGKPNILCATLTPSGSRCGRSRADLEVAQNIACRGDESLLAKRQGRFEGISQFGHQGSLTESQTCAIGWPMCFSKLLLVGAASTASHRP